MEVIPAINADSFEEIKERIKLMEPYVDWVQLDAADGTFAKNTIWHNAADLLSLETNLKIEVHLMVGNIEERIDEWLIAPVNRVIFHLEAAKDPYLVIDKCRKAGKEVGIAIGPDIPWTQLMPFCSKVDLFQILAVYPGLAGQEFKEESLEKIIYLRQNCPNCKIEVDGGVNKKVAKRVSEAGADIVSAANFIFKAKNIKKAIKDLQCL